MYFISVRQSPTQVMLATLNVLTSVVALVILNVFEKELKIGEVIL